MQYKKKTNRLTIQLETIFRYDNQMKRTQDNEETQFSINIIGDVFMIVII
jgi:hypothetical protein